MHKGMQVKSTEKVTSSGTSAQSAAFADNIYYVRVVADAACHIEFGSNPTATTSKVYVPADDIEYFKVSPGEKVAVIGTVNLYVSQLTE
jgi:hypothetical protein